MIDATTTPLLTKSAFVRGLDCELRLWLDRNRPYLKPPLSLATLERMETGKGVGNLARSLYPDGVFPVVLSGENASAAEATWRLLESEAVRIFEATVIANGMQVRVDVLTKNADGGYTVDEVKSSSLKEPAKIAEEKLYDLAFQVYVLSLAGLRVDQARLVLIDTSYVWPGGEYEAQKILGVVDVTGRCAELQPEISTRAEILLKTIANSDQPEVEKNTHCKKCDYFEHCRADLDPRDVMFLPGMTAKAVTRLRDQGFRTVTQIPADYKLPGGRARSRDVAQSGKAYIGGELGQVLADIPFPAAFIDYESSNPAFPIYAGTRPYEQVCFQWSAHVVASPGAAPAHHEFLASDATDPREEFCRTLWNVIEPCASIVHYTAYEKTQLRAMASLGILKAAELLEAIETRSVDLEKIVSDQVCFEEFHGRTSIKVVLPVLVPSMSYKDLKIADGTAAAVGFRRMISSDTPPAEAAELRAALLEYCRQDTLAMVEIYRALIKLAGKGVSDNHPKLLIEPGPAQPQLEF
jgi:predicted RecB family nuclease